MQRTIEKNIKKIAPLSYGIKDLCQNQDFLEAVEDKAGKDRDLLLALIGAFVWLSVGTPGAFKIDQISDFLPFCICFNVVRPGYLKQTWKDSGQHCRKFAYTIITEGHFQGIIQEARKLDKELDDILQVLPHGNA